MGKIKLKEVPNTKEHNKTWVDAICENAVCIKESPYELSTKYKNSLFLVASYLERFKYKNVKVRNKEFYFSSSDPEATYEDAVQFLKQRGKL